MSFATDQIRNIAIAGHGSTGKTTLLEHLLFQGGAIAKPETIESGKTVSDFGEDEIARKISVRATLSHCTVRNTKLNFIDTPGSSDFVGEVILAFRACESALLLIDARSGVQIETIKLWRNLDSRNKPRMVFVSRLDEDRASFNAALEDIKAKFKANPVPVTIPMGEGLACEGIIDVINGKAYIKPASGDQKEAASEVPAKYKDALEEARIQLSEAAAEGSDELMEKYLENGQLSQEEIVVGLRDALAQAKVIPAFAGSGLKNIGTAALLEFVAVMAPTPLTHNTEEVKDFDGNTATVSIDASKPASAMVIKTQIDQFSGRLSFVKVFTGSLTPELDVVNVRDGHKERLSKLYTAQGKKIEEVPSLVAGDIGIITKAVSLKTNDTVSAMDRPFSFGPLRLPTPVHLVAISATNKKEEDKLNELLYKAAEEDLTFQVNFNGETKETVIAGMGELQINMILDKIKNLAKIVAETRIPRVAYRETITKKSGAEYTHKKQTGGHGQYARVVFEVEPLARGTGYQFENKLFGQSVSRGFIPGIEKGIHQAMENGIVAGYPVVDVKTAITDGKEHPVDSSEMAFKLASRGAFREASKTANPTLLEPIMDLKVFVEEKNLGDVMSDLSGRRGRISGSNPMGGGIVEVDAQVPQAELLRYAIDLRSMTSGTASFEVDFSHYAPISGKIAEDVIKAAQAFKTAEAEEE
ncbi:MAG: elongation factor G [Spirochaetae bacterium HGW-Spirochaetae-9]|nr:MAG: elongation factor G [Spirochaetae bacterium HGW-Spirochaetae-9]